MKINKKELGFKFLKYGILVIPTLLPLSILLIFISGSISSYYSYKSLFKDKWSIPLFLSAIFMIASCFYNSFYSDLSIYSEYKNFLNWIGLANWIPFIWLFWALQSYLSKNQNRIICINFLLIGSIPVIIMGFLQSFFDIHGPFIFLNGLIHWFQYKLEGDAGLSSIFANANNAGAWFSVIFPFSLSFFIQSEQKKGIKLFFLINTFLIVISMVLTNSRATWASAIFSIFILTGFNKYYYLILLSIFLPFLSKYIPVLPNNIQEFITSTIPGKIIRNFEVIDYKLPLSNFYRIQIWITSIKLTLANPIFGWGAASFPILYMIENNLAIYHAHNLPLELAFNYGIISSLLIFIPIFVLLFKTYKNIFRDNKNSSFFDKSWWTATFSIIFLQMVDVQYYSARIGIIFWILIIGLKGYFNENLKLNVKK